MLASHHKDFEPLGQSAPCSGFNLGQRGNFDRIINQKSRLDQVLFRVCFKTGIQQLSPAHILFDFFQTVVSCSFPGLQICLIGIEIQPGVLADGVNHGQPAEGRFQRDLPALIVNLKAAIDLKTTKGEKRLSDLHHGVIITVGLVEFQHGEFRVVPGAHPLISELPADLIDPLHPTDNQTFEI